MNKVLQLPTNKFVIERYFTIIKELNNRSGSVDEAVNRIVIELEEIWVYCNVFPLSRTVSKKKVSSLVNDTKTLRKVNVSRHTSKPFQDKLNTLKKNLRNGFDIRCHDVDRLRELTKMFKIKMLQPEEDLWNDNCIPNNAGVCERKIYCGGEDKKWCKAAMKRYERSLRQQQSKNATTSTNDDNDLTSSSESDDNDDRTNNEDDSPYITPAHSFTVQLPKIPTRSSSSTLKENRDTSFKLQCRSGFRTMNTDMMVVLGLMVSKFGVSENKASECLQLMANTLFGQSLKLPSKEVVEEEEHDDDNEEEGTEEADEPTKKKKRMPFGDLSSTLPSPRIIHKWIEDQAILSLWHAADEIKNASSRDAAVTIGWDDTVKKAGHHRHDIKAGHATIIETDHTRSTYSTGLYENISHSGEGSSKTVEMVMQNMAVLTGISRDEFFSTIDFWINDRAGDNLTMLDGLGVQSEKRLFCNTHVLLTIDEGIDSAFRITESKTGKAKLISQDAGHVFTSPNNSIFYLGLIALSKLLSDSHCVGSISLYKDYKKFLGDQMKEGNEKATEVLKNQFMGFRSNRFGRIPYLSNVMLVHEELLNLFFDKNVDENANRLVLACFSFIHSPWFLLCCRVCARFKNILVDDITLALGIDQYKTKKSNYRSWSGMKVLFHQKLDMLSQMANSESDGIPTGFDLLSKKCASMIHDNIQRQLGYMSFFDEGLDLKMNETKLLQAPMTNDGCESELATCGGSIKKVGSTVSLATLSDRHVVVRNKLFENNKWKSLTISEKRDYMRWSRISKEAKLVKAKGKEYLQKVKAAVNRQLDVKAQKKKKKIRRCLDLLEKLKKNGGPVTADDIGRLQLMSTVDLLDQVAYLRCSIAPNIKQKRKVGNKFQMFSDEELRLQIIDVLKPTEDVVEDMNSLIVQVLSEDRGNVESATPSSKDINTIGKIGIWNGSFDRQCVGVQVTSDKLQLFRKVKRCYYKLSDLPEDRCEWALQETIPESDY